MAQPTYSRLFLSLLGRCLVSLKVSDGLKVSRSIRPGNTGMFSLGNCLRGWMETSPENRLKCRVTIGQVTNLVTVTGDRSRCDTLNESIKFKRL